MKKLILLIFLISQFSISVFADDWSPNLLINSGAEDDIGDEWNFIQGSKLSRQETYFGDDVYPYKGSYFYLANVAKITQDIDVSDYAHTIDGGNINVRIGAQFIERYYKSASCSFKLRYYDKSDTYLDVNSKSLDCDDTEKWTKREIIIESIPVQTRRIMFEINISNSYILFDEMYFNISANSNNENTETGDDQTPIDNGDNGTSPTGTETGDNPTPIDDEDEIGVEDNPTSPEIIDETSIETTAVGTSYLSFNELKPLYNVGETIKVSLTENLEVQTRFQRVDLWVVIELPDGSLLFKDNTIIGFSSEPNTFKKSLETSDAEHDVFSYDIPPGMGGNYSFYAVYASEGKSPMESFLNLRSNIAFTEAVLSNK